LAIFFGFPYFPVMALRMQSFGDGLGDNALAAKCTMIRARRRNLGVKTRVILVGYTSFSL